jgi:glycopeptide antibiotics resistance protein
VPDQVWNGVLAVALGLVFSVLLLLPTAAIQYRRDGRLGPSDLAILVGAAVYGLALWTYTLLPFPQSVDYRCRAPRLGVEESLAPVLRQGLLPLEELMRHPGFQQLSLNVLLFVPLGFFVRWIAHRGFFVTLVLGGVASFAIEITQLTGVWGWYPCAYRTFDVDDLITNTVGAFLGAGLAWALIHPDRDAPERLPTRVSLGRRWVGFVCDVIVLVVVGGTAALATRGWSTYVTHVSPETIEVVALAVPLTLQTLLVVFAGRTVGEWAISIRAVAHRLPTLLARLIKLATGVGGFALLAVPNLVWGGVALGCFIFLTLAVSIKSRNHRGLSHWLAGMELTISR